MALSWLRGEYVFGIVIGLVDGILTALILAAGKVLGGSEPIQLTDVVRIGVVASVSGAFIFFVAQYSQFRHELVHAEKHLTLGSRGHLAKTHLGRTVFSEAIIGAVISGACSFVGATFPLLFVIVWSGVPWLGIGAGIVALGILGAVLGRSAYGNVVLWSFGLMSVGALIAFIGVKLHFV